MVKLVVATEPGHDEAKRFWSEATELTSAVTAYAEARAALARALRGGRLTPRGAARAKADLDGRWAEVVGIEVGERLAHVAGELADRFPLRGYDSVHLAAALAVADIDVLVGTWDRELAEAARGAGLSVAP